MKLKPGDTVLVEATVVSAFNGYANVRIDAVNFAGEARRPLGGFVPFERIKRSEVCGSEDGKDAGRGRYHAVYNQARDCWDLMFRDVLCASFYVGRYPCAEDKVCAEVSRLNAEYGKEVCND